MLVQYFLTVRLMVAYSLARLGSTCEKRRSMGGENLNTKTIRTKLTLSPRTFELCDEDVEPENGLDRGISNIGVAFS